MLEDGNDQYSVTPVFHVSVGLGRQYKLLLLTSKSIYVLSPVHLHVELTHLVHLSQAEMLRDSPMHREVTKSVAFLKIMLQLCGIS